MKKTFYLIDGTTLTGEVLGTSTERIEIMDEDGNLWSLISRNVVRVCNGKARMETQDTRVMNQKGG